MLQVEPPQPTQALKTTYRVFVYHHTHWDREWWAPMQDFRIRLVELIDNLLDALDTDPEFRCFLLDGQTIVLKDYLEIRPENREKLVAYINDYRIQCGPWYILPDEFLVSGEAHIRNLWLGERMAERLGFRNLDVGYIPDTFGHISQMPQILRGFGIESALVWRGVGADASFKQEFMWEAADGSQVLAHWFPEGYYQMPFLHFDNPDRPDEDKVGRVRRLVETFAARATTDCVLLPYGGDHQPIDRRLPRLLADANATMRLEARDVRLDGSDEEQAPSPKPQASSYEFYWATTQEYMEAIRARRPNLEVRRGELRDTSPDLAHLLPGVLSARMYLKQLNFAGQTWLERYAEPLAALAWVHGRRYDAELLWTAWELLAQNHPHDSICGCSIDQVHREMLPRFDQSRQIAEIVTEKSAQHINAQIDTSSLADGELALVVHNTQARPRSGPVGVLVDRAPDVSPRTHILIDPDGAEVPFQVKPVDTLQPMSDRWHHAEIRFVAENLPALGYAAYRLARREIPLNRKQLFFNAVQPTAQLKGSASVGDLRVGDGVLENRWLRVEVNQHDGTLRVTDKRSGEVYAGLNAFEDGGDAGDSYNYAAPLNDIVLRSDGNARVHVSLAEAGYASATLRIDLDWSLPAGLSEDRLSRSADYLVTRISTFVTLAAGLPRVEIATEWDNRVRDHRLRALFPLGAPIAVAHAEGHFDVLTRPVGTGETGAGWPEPPAATLPQQGWVSVDDGRRGLTIANRGLPEFEVISRHAPVPSATSREREGNLPLSRGRDWGAGGEGATLALTLVRAVGWLSREDLLARVGGAGPTIPTPDPTPDAQCPGRQRVEYAVMPHRGDWLAARADLDAHDYLAPLYGTATGRHAGTLPARGGLLEIAGDHSLIMSACKKAEGSDALILRFWNVSKRPTEACVRPHERPSAARLVDLKEHAIADGELSIADDGSFGLRAGPAQIVTVEIRL
jgi:mannosylglycerate hydrolase